MKEADNEELELDAWQTVGAVTAKLLLHLMDVNFHTPDDENLVDDQPTHDALPPSHVHNSKM